MFMRGLSRSLLCVALLVTQSCTRMITYPSPQPVVGERIETVEDVSGRLHPLLKAMSELCGDPPNTLLDRSRSQSTFGIGGVVGLCFARPKESRPPNVSRHMCESGSSSGIFGKASTTTIFPVFVAAGTEVVVEVEQARATLEVHGHSQSEQAEITPWRIGYLGRETIVNGRMLYDVNGSLLSPNEALVQNSTAGYRLDFSFHVTCDPDTTYRVSVAGIKIDGREVSVPVVKFIPRSGRVQLPF
jgi:hypothetical protein